MASERFVWALELMRSEDPRLRGRGFDFLREHADAYVDELVAEFGRENDGELRCLLLELICETRALVTLPVLVAELESEDESLRFWAVRGLEMLDTPEAQRELRRARADGLLA